MKQSNPLQRLYIHLSSQSLFREQNIEFFFHHNVIIAESCEEEICRLRYNTLTEEYEFLSLIYTIDSLSCVKEPVYILDIEQKIVEKKKRIS